MSDEGYNEISIRVTSSSDGVTEDWDKIKAKGKELGDTKIRIPVEAADPVTEEWRKKVQTEIRAVGKEALKIPMDPDSAEFRAEVAATLADLKSFAKEPVPLEMADADKFRASVEAMVASVSAEVRAITVPVVADSRPSASDVPDLTQHETNDLPPTLRPPNMPPAKITVEGDPYADAMKKIHDEPEPTIPIKALDPIDAAWVAKVQAGIKAAAKDSLKIPADPNLDGFRAKLASELAGVSANLKAGIPADLTEREAFRAEAIETVEALRAELKLKIPVEADTSAVESTAKSAGGQMSGLIVAAVAAGVVAGGPLIGGALVAGTAVGMAALGAYIQRGNPAIQQGWQKLAADAKAGAMQASQSMVPPIAGALNQIDSMVVAQQPMWTRMFTSAGQDVPILTGGLVQLADNALPGLDHALTNSTGIAGGFAKILAETGGVVGGLGDATAQNSSRIGGDLNQLASTVHILGGDLDSLVGITSGLGAGALPVLNGALQTTDNILAGVHSTLGPLEPLIGGVALAGIAGWKLLPPVWDAATKASKGVASGLTNMAAGLESTAPKLSNAALGAASLVESLGPAGLLAAGGLALVVMEKLGQDAAQTAQDEAKLAGAIQVTAGVLRDANGAVTDSTRAAEAAALQNQDWVQTLTDSGASLKDVVNAALGVPGAMDKVTSSVQGVTKSSDPTKVVAVGKALVDLASSAPGAVKANKDLADASGKTATANGNLIGSFHTMATVQDTAANGFANLKSKMADAQTAEGNLKQATSDLLLELQTAGEGGMQKANDAIRLFASGLTSDVSSMKDATGSILTSGGALDNFSQKGQDVAKILEDAQSSWAAYATGAKQAGVSTTGVTSELTLMQGQLEKTLEGLGLTKGQADKLITSFGLIPASIATDVSAPGAAEAFTNVEDLKNELKALPPGQSVTVTGITSDAEKKLSDLGYHVTHMPNGTVQIDGDTSLVVGSAIKAVKYIDGLTAWIDIQGNNQVKGAVRMQAGGGPSSGMSIIHDQGAEAVRLPTGSMVMPHANTNIAMQQAQNQSVHVELSLSAAPGAQSAVSTMIMNLVRSGNIQLTANGQRVKVGG